MPASDSTISRRTGQKINLSDSPQGFYQLQRDWAVVIGVVHHVQYHSLTAMVRPQIYVPYPLARNWR